MIGRVLTSLPAKPITASATRQAREQIGADSQSVVSYSTTFKLTTGGQYSDRRVSMRKLTQAPQGVINPQVAETMVMNYSGRSVTYNTRTIVHNVSDSYWKTQPQTIQRSVGALTAIDYSTFNAVKNYTTIEAYTSLDEFNRTQKSYETLWSKRDIIAQALFIVTKEGLVPRYADDEVDTTTVDYWWRKRDYATEVTPERAGNSLVILQYENNFHSTKATRAIITPKLYINAEFDEKWGMTQIDGYNQELLTDENNYLDIFAPPSTRYASIHGQPSVIEAHHAGATKTTPKLLYDEKQLRLIHKSSDSFVYSWNTLNYTADTTIFYYDRHRISRLLGEGYNDFDFDYIDANVFYSSHPRDHDFYVYTSTTRTRNNWGKELHTISTQLIEPRIRQEVERMLPIIGSFAFTPNANKRFNNYTISQNFGNWIGAPANIVNDRSEVLQFIEPNINEALNTNYADTHIIEHMAGGLGGNKLQRFSTLITYGSEPPWKEQKLITEGLKPKDYYYENVLEFLNCSYKPINQGSVRNLYKKGNMYAMSSLQEANEGKLYRAEIKSFWTIAKVYVKTTRTKDGATKTYWDTKLGNINTAQTYTNLDDFIKANQATLMTYQGNITRTVKTNFSGTTPVWGGRKTQLVADYDIKTSDFGHYTLYANEKITKERATYDKVIWSKQYNGGEQYPKINMRPKNYRGLIAEPPLSIVHRSRRQHDIGEASVITEGHPSLTYRQFNAYGALDAHIPQPQCVRPLQLGMENEQRSLALAPMAKDRPMQLIYTKRKFTTAEFAEGEVDGIIEQTPSTFEFNRNVTINHTVPMYFMDQQTFQKDYQEEYHMQIPIHVSLNDLGDLDTAIDVREPMHEEMTRRINGHFYNVYEIEIQRSHDTNWYLPPRYYGSAVGLISKDSALHTDGKFYHSTYYQRYLEEKINDEHPVEF